MIAVNKTFLEIKSELQANGYSIVGKLDDQKLIHGLINFIDCVDSTECEINYSGSEKRIWNAEEKSEKVRNLKLKYDELYFNILEEKKECTILAYSNKPLQSLATDVKGRWHLDSFNNQYKIFTFLKDVDEGAGPFEFVNGTHMYAQKLKYLLMGKVISIGDIFTGKRRYQSLDDSWMAKLVSDRGSKKVMVDSGSVVIINTSLIHRASPCIANDRYAVAGYF